MNELGIEKMMDNSIKKDKERNDGFDILKCFASFLVICIHCPFPGIAGDYFTAFTRIAVPLFLMISGYYYTRIINRKREKKQIIKILFIVIEANLLYFAWDVFYAYLSGEQISVYIKSLLSMKNLLTFIAFNESPFASHLWYLSALLYTLICMHFIFKSTFFKKRIWLLLGLLLIDLILGKYSLLIFGKQYSVILVRNFIFVGIPYFVMGYLLNELKIRQNIIFLKGMFILFTLTTFIERYVLVLNHLNAERDHYISTTFLACTVFLLFSEMSSQRNTVFKSFMAKIGREYSTGVYIIHPMFVMIISYVVKRYGMMECLQYIMPFIVLIFSVLGVALYKILIRKIILIYNRS